MMSQKQAQDTVLHQHVSLLSIGSVISFHISYDFHHWCCAKIVILNACLLDGTSEPYFIIKSGKQLFPLRKECLDLSKIPCCI